MTALYGPDNPNCDDSDGDGFSVLAGDPDDTDPDRHPGATEVANGLDDDGDGLIDEQVLAEGDDFPSWPPRDLALPAEVSGTVSPQDADAFSVSLPSDPETQTLNITVCSTPTGAVWHGVYDESGNWTSYDSTALGPGCRANTYSLAGGHTWTIYLGGGVDPTSYSMKIVAWPWPAPWGAAEPVGCSGSHYRLRSSTQSLSGVLADPTQVRFWVSGAGFVGSAAYASPASFDWSSSVVQPEVLGYRAQLVSGSTPVEDATAARWFSSQDCPALSVSIVLKLQAYSKQAACLILDIADSEIPVFVRKCVAPFVPCRIGPELLP